MILAVRVGIIMPLAEQYGGAEMAFLHYLRGLPQTARAQVSLCFLEPGSLVEQTRGWGFEVVVIPSGRLRRPLDGIGCIWRLRRWLRERQLRIVLSWMAKAHLYAGPAAALAGVPALWWQHGLPANHGIDLLATLMPTRRVLACSNAVALLQRKIRGNRNEPTVIYPPIDLAALNSAGESGPIRARLGLPAGAMVVGIVARQQRWKGIHVLLDAIARLAPEYPDLCVAMVGGAHPFELKTAAEIQALCTAPGLAGRVHLLGHRTDVPDCIAAMDIVVSASLAEPFGMVIAEAMAMGKPVVATAAGGPPEIITDGVDGLLVPPADPQALAQALRRLLREPALRTNLGAAARVRATGFDIPRFVDEVSAAIAAAAAS